MKKLTALFYLLLLLFVLVGCGELDTGGTLPDPDQNQTVPSAEGVMVKMVTPNGEVLMKLVDCAASRDWVARLKQDEMTLLFSDFAGSEKIATPTPPFNTAGAKGCDPTIGDVTIYQPWGNIAVFYRDSSGYSSALTLLGKIQGDGVSILSAQNQNFSAIIKLA